MATMDVQIEQLLVKHFAKLQGQASSVARQALVLGHGGELLLDTVGRLQTYAEMRGIDTRILGAADVDVIERDWIPSNSADALACLSSIRTVLKVDSGNTHRGMGESSFRVALRFNCGTIDEYCNTTTFFIVCYDSSDRDDCDRTTDTLRHLATWRAKVLDITTQECALRSVQSDGRTIGLLVNIAPPGAIVHCDETTRRYAAAMTFIHYRVDVSRPRPVNDLCNALLLTTLRCIDVSWNPPRQPRDPARDDTTTTTDDDGDEFNFLCALLPAWFSSFLCTAPPSLQKLHNINNDEPLSPADTLVLSPDDFNVTPPLRVKSVPFSV